MFGRLLGWYTIHTFCGALASWRNFATCKIHFASKSCIFPYWQRFLHGTRAAESAKLCGVVLGMELRNFRRGRHLYSAGRPSRLALAHILVYHFVAVKLRGTFFHYITCYKCFPVLKSFSRPPGVVDVTAICFAQYFFLYPSVGRSV